MNKKLITLGIVVLLISIGLSGCNGIGIGITSINDIQKHPNSYLNKTVTIRAITYITTPLETPDFYTLSDDTGIFYAKVTDNIDTLIVISGGECDWTGIIRYDNNLFAFDKSKELYMELTEIKAV